MTTRMLLTSILNMDACYILRIKIIKLQQVTNRNEMDTPVAFRSSSSTQHGCGYQSGYRGRLWPKKLSWIFFSFFILLIAISNKQDHFQWVTEKGTGRNLRRNISFSDDGKGNLFKKILNAQCKSRYVLLNLQVHDIDHFILITSEALKMFLKAIASCSFQCKIEYKKYHFFSFC